MVLRILQVIKKRHHKHYNICYKPQRIKCDNATDKTAEEKSKMLENLRAQYPNGAAAYEVLDFIGNQEVSGLSEKSVTSQ